MNTLLTLIFIITASYVILLILFSIGWFRLHKFHRHENSHETKVSIIIAVRNEEKNIVSCLTDLTEQDYPAILYEILVMDDDSDDNTERLINSFINTHNNHNIKLLSNKDFSKGNGKKAAISNCIDIATGKLIITTDGDCRFGHHYISAIVNYYVRTHSKMILGPVCFSNDKSLFEKLQSLEFMSLIGSSAGAVKTIGPIMCNGANLAYEKEAFKATDAYSYNMHYASGDDIFLMLNINKKYRNSIHFIKSRDAIVFTESKKTLKSFFEQRKRWVSKTKGLKSLKIILVALIVFLFNMSVAGLLIASFIYHNLTITAITLLIIKIIIDYPILHSIADFMKRKKLMKYYIPLQFIYIFYIPIIAVAGNIYGFKWKGRNINN